MARASNGPWAGTDLAPESEGVRLAIATNHWSSTNRKRALAAARRAAQRRPNRASRSVEGTRYSLGRASDAGGIGLRASAPSSARARSLRMTNLAVFQYVALRLR